MTNSVRRNVRHMAAAAPDGRTSECTILAMSSGGHPGYYLVVASVSIGNSFSSLAWNEILRNSRFYHQ